MIDANAVAGYRRALARRGQPVIVRRVNGDAPNTATFDARCWRSSWIMWPSSQSRTSSPRATSRSAPAMSSCWTTISPKRFPLPVTKNDKVIVLGVEGEDEELNII